MSHKLVIVESPVKAKTIEKYLGTSYHVLSSNGHVRDLPEKKLGIDIEQSFTPTYVVDPKKEALLSQLMQEAKKADTIYLASDDDREGEAISWHIQQALNLQEEKTKRITFRAITKKDIQNAMANPRKIDMDRVSSQEARRILDRIVGYQGSPLLWKAIKPSLSAGRVQSVAVRIIVEQEDAIHRFIPTSGYKVTSSFDLGQGSYLKADLPKPFAKKEEANSFLQACQKATFTLAELKQTESQRKPNAPYTTSSLQQAASQILGFSIKETMNHAQLLYEQGKITYMRTDSTNLSEEAHQQAKKLITKQFGASYYSKNIYKSESDIAQEAHEAIRPTHMEDKVGSDNPRSQRLYTLIREHTLASQMTNAIFHKTHAHIAISTRPEWLLAKGEILHFAGFLAAYKESKISQKTVALPKLKTGQNLSLDVLEARQTFTRPPARYTEASLVQKLKDLKIGRPSTYVPIIATIQQRNYVVKESRPGRSRDYISLQLKSGKITETKETETTGTENSKLFPTDTGIIVNKFLARYCDKIVDYQFTAKVEKELDKIARQDLSKEKMLKTFYAQFETQVNEAKNAQEDIRSRTLGVDEVSQEPIIARFSSRYGPLVQMGATDSDTKPRFASLRPGQLLAYITLEEARKLFELPREIGTFEEAPISAHIGRYGPYLKHQNAFYTIPPSLDPYTIDKAAAIEVIEEKRKSPQGIIRSFAEDSTITVRSGRFGPYIKTPTRNIKIPKDKDPATLTLADCQEIIAQAPAKKKRGFRKAKA